MTEEQAAQVLFEAGQALAPVYWIDEETYDTNTQRWEDVDPNEQAFLTAIAGVLLDRMR